MPILGVRFGFSLSQVEEFWAGADHGIEARIERKCWGWPVPGHEVGDWPHNKYGEDP